MYIITLITKVIKIIEIDNYFLKFTCRLLYEKASGIEYNNLVFYYQ